MNISTFTLIGVFLLIAVRQVGKVRFEIWEVMVLGAMVVVVAGEISVRAALASINIDVLVFLFGMFVVGQALDESGYLSHVSYRYFRRAKSVNALILFLLFGFGFASALLMNDTVAIVGTPVVLLLAKKHEMPPKLLLLTLCFAVTTGSVVSPIGNPQNLLVAIHGGMENPFGDFFRWLFVPTVVNIFIAFLFLKKYYRVEFHSTQLNHSQERIRDHNLALLSKISLATVLVLIVFKVAIFALRLPVDFRLTHIAVIAALPVLIGSPKRYHILKHVDWRTLMFFAAMFVLMESVWESGVLQGLLRDTHLDVSSVGVILSVSVLVSQIVSNVPLVALFQPMLIHTGATVKEFVALAAGSTIAGNLFVLGAASNVIVIQNAEKRNQETITFWEFARIGVPMTLVQTFVYWLAFRYL